MSRVLSLLAFCLAAVALAAGARDPQECEVCIAALTAVKAKLPAGKTVSLTSIEDTITDFCAKPPTEKEGKLCYYVEPIKREISNPMKNGVPVDKICDRLKKKSSEVCSLRFQSSAPPKAAEVQDFSKLRVKDLKYIMSENGITCPECLEKSDFVRKLEQHFGKKADL